MEKQMNERMFTILVLAAVAGTGMIAGVFLAFSSFIMPALARLPPSAGISAMQNINITVINPLFMAVLFGTAILSLILAFGLWRNGAIENTALIYLGIAFYVGGAILTTMVFNVPLNDALANAAPESEAAAQIWRQYLADWTFWNSVRGAASFASCVLLTASLCHW
jgi:uncharacterized membrane protein